MSDDDHNPFGPLERRATVQDPAAVLGRATRVVRTRRRRRRVVGGVVVVVVVAGLVAAWPRSDEPVGLATTNDSNGAPQVEVAPVDDDAAAPCGSEMPLFVADSPMVGAEDPVGSPGPGPGSVPVEAGQLVAFWASEFDLIIEMRWPGTAIPAEAPAEVLVPTGETPRVWPDAAAPGAERVYAFIEVDGGSDPCSMVSVEAYGPRLDPAYDFLFAFAAGLRPVEEKAAYLAALADEVSRAPRGDRPMGACDTLVPTTVDESGDPDLESMTTLAERFLADRLAGLAAEPCLTRPALESLEVPPENADQPQVCLYECDGGRLVAGSVQQTLPWGVVELVVDYEGADGAVVRLREELAMQAVPDGNGGDAVLISAVLGAPWSDISETIARQVVANFLDALAAEEYGIALGLLINEGWSDEVQQRLGVAPGESPSADLLERFCDQAACGAPYQIGPTVRGTAFTRELEVTFDTTDGPVTQPMRLGMFEGITNLNTLPPDGAPGGTVARLDERLFGEPYEGDLTVVRYRSVERYRDGTPEWAVNWRLGAPEEFEVAGDFVVVPDRGFSGGGASAITVDSERVEISDSPHEYAGAGRIGGRNLAFTTSVGDERSVVAHDLVTGDTFALLDDDREEGAWYVDVGSDRVAVLRVIGESTAVEVHEIDPGSLTLGPLVSRIDPEGYIGRGHIAPDGETIVATLDPSFYDPTRTVALFDMAASVMNHWEVAGVATIERLDYEGRWIVAELSDDTLWVIDTRDETTRIVDSPVSVRFG